MISIKFGEWLSKNYNSYRGNWIPKSERIFEIEGKIRDSKSSDVRTTDQLFNDWMRNDITREFEKTKEEYLSKGYEMEWGDGGLNTNNICIMKKGTVVPIEHKPDKVKTISNYVVISLNERVVEFHNVEFYSS